MVSWSSVVLALALCGFAVTTDVQQCPGEKSLQDIITLFKQTDPDDVPAFVAKQLHKLPPVTFDHVDVTRLLRDITSLKASLAEVHSKLEASENTIRRSISGLTSDVQLTPCKKLPCKLKKGTNQHITINFTTENEIQDLTNHVTAEVLGLDLPFVGVDGQSICDKLLTESGEQASCPLRAGTKYTYKDSFPILAFYPSIHVKVSWSLQDTKKNNIVCFQVPARITG